MPLASLNNLNNLIGGPLLFALLLIAVAAVIMILLRVSGINRSKQSESDELLKEMADYSRGSKSPKAGAAENTAAEVSAADRSAEAAESMPKSTGRETVELEVPKEQPETVSEPIPEPEPAPEPVRMAKPALRVVCVDNRVPAVAEIGDTLEYEEQPVIAENIGDIFSQDFRNRSSEGANSYIDNLTLGDLGVAVGPERKSGSSDKIEEVISQINNINTEALKTDKAAEQKAAEDAEDETLKVFRPSGTSDEKRKSQEFDVESSSEQPAASVRYRVPAQYGVKNMSVDKNGRVHTLAELRNQIR